MAGTRNPCYLCAGGEWLGSRKETLIDLVAEYRDLLVKLDAGDLGPADRSRLAALKRRFAPCKKGQGSRHHRRICVDLRGTLKTSDIVQSVHVVNLSGGGVGLTPAPLLEPGEHATLQPLFALQQLQNRSGSALGDARSFPHGTAVPRASVAEGVLDTFLGR